MKKVIIKLAICINCMGILFSCVPAKQLEYAKGQYERCNENVNKLKKENENLTSANNELKAANEKLTKDNNALIADTAFASKNYRTLTMQYDKISDLNRQLLESQEKLRQGADQDAQKAMQMLQQTRDDLLQKENQLSELEKRLNAEKANLEAMKIQNGVKESEIAEKSARVKELEDRLNAQNDAMKALKQKISDALTNFEGEGLSVYMKDGNVYVSLEEQLLFKSGKWDVDTKGVEALKKLAGAIEKNPDINIMIEGHTDDVPLNGNGNIADNWDLSVKRATSIVKILLANSSINPANITPSGRSSYVPIDNAKTSEARAKNRRTEIILTPKLNTLYEIVNQ
ncbi:MAG: OmpA family protein [Bacteroidales bacterium]|nr:OmpA family protein [Bacteroidales bacterium]